jgi:hypothetical protein
MKEILRKLKFIIYFASSSCFDARYSVERFDRELWLTSKEFSMVPHAHISAGDEHIPAGGRNSETQSDPVDMMIIIIISYQQL